jgi:hypothetical protein
MSSTSAANSFQGVMVFHFPDKVGFWFGYDDCHSDQSLSIMLWCNQKIGSFGESLKSLIVPFNQLWKKGQFLILATPCPASSGDTRDGSDNRACP